jgi:hypothetical protein
MSWIFVDRIELDELYAALDATPLIRGRAIGMLSVTARTNESISALALDP